MIPHLEVNPVWQDSRYGTSKPIFAYRTNFSICKSWLLMKINLFICSSFTEIFDVDHFISALNDEISIVKELPSKYSWSTREYYATGIRDTRIKTAPVHASANWYLENVLPMLERYVVI